MTYEILERMAQRHSFYDIKKECPLDEQQIISLIQTALKLYPSPFNSQSARLLLLFGEQNQKFWNLTETELLKSAPIEKAENIKTKISAFSAGFGTILFFTDMNIIKKQETQMPLYAENFKNWAYQSNAILQFMIWSALADKNTGASLQHYNPLINDAVKTAFQIPSQWELVAQMPFGGINHIPAPHGFDGIEDKLIIRQ